MKRKFIITGLLVLIIASFSFVGLKLAASGPDDNYFNRNLRTKLAQSPGWRSILDLHYDGDAAADYLGTRYGSIFMEVKAEAGLALGAGVLHRLSKEIETLTGKPVDYEVSATYITDADANTKTPQELAEIYRTGKAQGAAASLFLLLLAASPDDPDLLGLTLREDGIVLYLRALSDFTERALWVLPDYQFSTFLHEFGHQLGLGHNELPGCLMNEHAERKGGYLELSGDVITDFCPEEYKQIAKIKAQVNN